MAVVINQPDANAGLNSFVGGVVEGRDKAMALALTKEKQAADERNQTRQLDIQQQKTTSDVMAQQSQMKIAEAQEAYRKKVEPILEGLAQAQLNGAVQDVAIKTSQAQVAQIDAEFKAQLHAAGLDMKQAQATMQETQTSIQRNVAQTLQANAATKTTNALRPGEVAQQGATLQNTQANTANTNASTALTNRTPGTTPNGGGANYTGALEQYTALSPGGQKIVDAVESGQMTDRAGALAAKKMGAEAPKIIAAFSNLDADPAKKSTTTAGAQNEVEKTPGFDGLPGNVQAAILRQTKNGVAPKAAAQVVIDATDTNGKPAVDPGTQMKIKQVFGIGAPTPAPTRAPAPVPTGNPFANIGR